VFLVQNVHFIGRLMSYLVKLVLGRHASEEVILQLVKSKCMPMLLYRLECFALLKSDIKSIDFAATRFLIKLFRTSNTDIINNCRSNLSIMLKPNSITLSGSKLVADLLARASSLLSS